MLCRMPTIAAQGIGWPSVNEANALSGRSVGPAIGGVRGMAPAAVWAVVAVIAASVLSSACVSHATPHGYSVISTSTSPALPSFALAPNAQGYVRVETRSGSPRCSVTREVVACQTLADDGPSDPQGGRFHTASVGADGEFRWFRADLGALAGRVTMDYQTYTAPGWTIVATPEAVTFTTDSSGHGMSVSDHDVTPF